MHVHGIPKSSDRKHTWIACIICKIPQKKVRVVKTSIYYPPNRHIASPLAMKERKRKINSNIIYTIMPITSKNFKWHDDQTLTWNIKDIKLKLQQELSNNLSNHNS